jgi:hypothetical protein
VLFRVAALALVTVSLSATGFLMLTWLRPPEPASAVDTGPAKGPRLFYGWPRERQPDLLVLLSGQTHGYMQPCGCSPIQHGGLERRYNFVQYLTRERGWPVVAVDLGDVPQRSGLQALIKYRYIMEAMKRIHYTAVAVGQNEMAMPLLEALGEFALNNPSPRVLAANLLKKEDNFPGMVASWVVAADRGPRVGVVGVVGPSVAREVKDDSVKFADVEGTLADVLRQLAAQKPELLVLLFQGSDVEAQACARKFPQFQVILSLTEEEQPPSRPTPVGGTLVVRVGHKGQHVGAVGVYRTGKPDKPFDLYYDLIALGPEWKTPEDKVAGHPILGLYEDYAREVKDRDYLAHYAKTAHPIQQEEEFKKATYVGSEKCKKCHEPSYKVWKDSPHSRAYSTLEKATRPGLRQYDGECVVCHVVGFAYNGGFTNEKEAPQLKDNGCENCHGPGSLHVKDNYNAKLNALMNPYKTPEHETEKQKESRLFRLDQSCMKCHDTDNDVNWKLDKWITGHIVHKEPKE